MSPDSFSDGGKFVCFDSALKQVELMIENGVDIIDIGGESTRPGAVEVSEQDEISRVIPLLKAIKSRFSIRVSIDTSKPEVMSEAITYGADMINDVRDLQNKGCLDVVTQSELVSLRLSGKQRIYGIQDRGVLLLLWWDPDHKIYPVKKKGT